MRLHSNPQTTSVGTKFSRTRTGVKTVELGLMKQSKAGDAAAARGGVCRGRRIARQCIPRFLLQVELRPPAPPDSTRGRRAAAGGGGGRGVSIMRTLVANVVILALL